MGVQIGAGIVGHEHELVNTAGQDVLLQLRVIGLGVSHGHGHHAGILNALSQLDGGLDGVQIVGGHHTGGLRAIDGQIGIDDEILVVGHDLNGYCNDHVHNPLSGIRGNCYLNFF